jgi:hypothetical protein
VKQYDGGKMDGADLVPIACNVAPCPLNPQYFYVQSSDVQPYFQMAEQYTFGDRMFQTNEGPSFPAHQFIISGTSAPTATSNLFVSENTSVGTGCAAPPSADVFVVDPQGKESSKIYPCTEHPTLTDQLNAKNLSWRYYTPSATSIWTGPNAIQPTHVRAECAASEWHGVYRFGLGQPCRYLQRAQSRSYPHRHHQQSTACSELGDSRRQEFGSRG